MRLGTLNRPRHRRRMGQIERTNRYEVSVMPFSIGSDCDVHSAIFLIF